MRDKRQKDMRTKRVIALALAIAMIISFPSCSGLLPSFSAKKEAKKNFEYLRNKDIDKLVALFSDDSEKGFVEKTVGGFITYTD